MLLSSKAMAMIPQQGWVRQLKHYIISIELFWKEEPEEKGKGARIVRRKKRKKTTYMLKANICYIPVQMCHTHYLNQSSQEACKVVIKNQLYR